MTDNLIEGMVCQFKQTKLRSALSPLVTNLCQTGKPQIKDYNTFQ